MLSNTEHTRTQDFCVLRTCSLERSNTCSFYQAVDSNTPNTRPNTRTHLEHRTHSNTGFLCSSNVFPRTLEHMFLLPSCRLEHAEHTFEHTNTPRTPNTSNTVQSQTPRTHSELSTRTRDQDIHISTSTAVLPKQLTFSNTVPNTTEHQPEHIF